ncbi:anion permease, partial [Arthrospira platensis SPKY1]|nr:anion permease [Arthrospira platensis SPKY1]
MWTRPRQLTVFIFLFTVLGWVFSAPLGAWLGVAHDMDTVVAMTAIVLLAVTGVLQWQDIERQTQWGVLILFGGGLALSQVMATTGASLFLAERLVSGLGQAPAWLILLAL